MIPAHRGGKSRWLISLPSRVIRHFQERMPHGLFVPEGTRLANNRRSDAANDVSVERTVEERMTIAEGLRDAADALNHGVDLGGQNEKPRPSDWMAQRAGPREPSGTKRNKRNNRRAPIGTS
jgi:hypothetical protein